MVPAVGERSPSHARNVGAERATRPWILFLDADCQAPGDLIDRFFAAGDRRRRRRAGGRGRPGGGWHRPGRSLRLGQELPGPGRAPRSPLPAARRGRQPAGAPRGVRSGRRVLRGRARRRGHGPLLAPAARGLAARGAPRGGGRAPLPHHRARPAPTVARLCRRAGVAGPPLRGLRPPTGADPGGRPGAAPALVGAAAVAPPPSAARQPAVGRLERGRFLALDAVLGVEELAGFALSNRPRRPARDPARVVLIADRFPARDDPLADFALTLVGARVEAAARPEALGWRAAQGLTIDYREDDGAGARALALMGLLASPSGALRARPHRPSRRRSDAGGAGSRGGPAGARRGRPRPSPGR